MKKPFFLLCVLLLTGILWADTLNSTNKKITDIAIGDGIDTNLISSSNLFENKKVYYLEGFDFETMGVGEPGLLELNRGEISAIQNGLYDGNKTIVTPAGADSYSIVGHSQGGMRALGYITELKRQYPGSQDQIDAVVTVSGAVWGGTNT